MAKVVNRPVYVVGDNLDTEQIIPAQSLTLVPTILEEYKKLGSYAMVGLPDELYPDRFIAEGRTESDFKIVIAGKNFGCGSSREHAPIALGAAGGEAVVAGVGSGGLVPSCGAGRALYACPVVQRQVGVSLNRRFA